MQISIDSPKQLQDCIICLYPITNDEKPYIHSPKKGKAHHYHDDCISRWFKENPNIPTACPLCKESIKWERSPPLAPEHLKVLVFTGIFFTSLSCVFGAKIIAINLSKVLCFSMPIFLFLKYPQTDDLTEDEQLEFILQTRI